MSEQNEDYSQPPSEPNRTVPAVYDFLDDAVFINLPGSGGREPVGNGTKVVSSFMTADKYAAVPEEMHGFDGFDEYRVASAAEFKGDPDEYLSHLLDIERARMELTTQAFETYDPEIGFVLFPTTDWGAHYLSRFDSPERRREFYATVVERVDEYARRLTKDADNVLLLSDHGFEYKHTNVHVNDWLRDNGYLATQDTGRGPFARLVDGAKWVAERSEWLHGALRKAYNRIWHTSVGEDIAAAMSVEIEFSRSRAWELTHGCVYLNDEWFDSPTVEDRAGLIRTLREELSALTDENGQDVFAGVYTPEEVYEDPEPGAPDLLLRPSAGYFLRTFRSPSGGYTSRTANFEHRRRGLYAARGPMFATSGDVDTSIVNILPTLLAGLGEPLSPSFDGSVEEDLLARTPSVEVLSRADIPKPQTANARDGEVRNDAVAERLADLGYVE